MLVPFVPFAPDAANLVGQHHAGKTPVIPGSYNLVPTVTGYRTIPLQAVARTNNDLTSGDTDTICGALAIHNMGNTEVFAGNKSKLFWSASAAAVGGTAQNYIASKAGGYTLAAADFWDFTQFGQYVIAVSGGDSGADATQVIDSTTLGLFADLGGSPPKAKTVTTVRDFVVMGHTYDATDGERSTRVWWSGFGDHTSWTPSAATMCDFQDLQTSVGAVQRVIGGNNAFIVCSDAIVMMVQTGPPTIFDFEYIHPNIGTAHPLSAVRVGEYLYLYSKQGFLRVGTQPGDVTPIGAGRVDVGFRDAATTGTGVIHAAHDPANQSITWSFGVAGNYGGMSWCYNYAHDQWWVLKSATGFADVNYIFTSDVLGLATIGAFESEALIEYASSSQGSTWRGSTGYVQYHEGRRTLINCIRPVIEHYGTFSGVSLETYAYNDPARNQSGFSALSSTSVNSNTSDGVFDVLVEGRYIQIEIEGASSTSIRNEVIGVDVEKAAPTGRY